tara:strand:+ start:123 stop:440 length:318 start_codon:yes stop_codon:yes gene_type:complete
MKNTNEIEKQLQRKADNYLEQKAQEIFNIYQEINKYVSTSQNFYDYITHYNQYKDARPEDKSDHTSYVEPHAMKKKFELELAMNYKQKLVAKYTKELIAKLEIFE